MRFISIEGLRCRLDFGAKWRPELTVKRTLPLRAQRVSIYLSQTQHHGHASDYVEIVNRARKLGMAGATVVQGIQGFGTSSSLHRRHARSVAAEVPVVVTLIDTQERVEAFLAEIRDVTVKGTVTRRDVQVIFHG